jgi:dUTPase
MKTITNYDIPVKFVEDIDWENLFTKTLPDKKSPYAAGYDVVAVGEPKIIGEREPQTNLWKRIDYIEYRTGIQVGPEFSKEGFTHVLAFPRSSISNYNLMLANSIGVIDNDYRGEILLRFKYTWQPEDYLITRDKINRDDNSFMLGVVGNMNWEKIYRTGDRICQLVAMPHSDLNFFEVDSLNDTDRGSGGFESTGR